MAAVSRSGQMSRIRPRKYLEYPSQMPRNEEAGEDRHSGFCIVPNKLSSGCLL